MFAGQSCTVLRGWRLPSRTWNHWTSPSTKQLTWLRIVHSGEWCLRLALRTHSGARQKWMSEWMVTEFTSVSLDDVVTAVAGLPDKSSALDPIPVPVLKAVSDLLAPFLTYLFNISLSSGRVPAAFKDFLVLLLSRNLDRMRVICRPTGLYRIYLSFPRLWNVSSRDN